MAVITVTVYLKKSGEIAAYNSHGHAQTEESKDYTALKVCNGLSAIEYQFLYAVKSLCPDLRANFEIDEGGFKMSASKNVFELGSKSQECLQKYRVLSQSLIIGLEMLKKHHSHSINVKILNT